MEQYTDNQYDDDLTVETDQYDESYYTDADDLFDLSADEESPIGRLKSLILSIDWEITDEVLLQFNEELLDLRDIWAGEKINLVYVQALEKISKYIYHKKAESHPNAIKLLLTLYHNLEKIVSSPDLSETERNAILLEDVKRFEGLKKIIGRKVSKSAPVSEEQVGEKFEAQPRLEDETSDLADQNIRAEELTTLKAIVLGIDWEIRDEDLEELRQEVTRLKEIYAESKPRLILLQGIGTLGTYIKLNKSDALAEAFKVLQYFYESLEKIVVAPLSLEEEKEILFPAVEMFNSFKTQLSPDTKPEVTSQKLVDDEGEGEEISVPDGSALAPALSEIPADEAKGFHAEEEARGLGSDNYQQIDTHIDDFLPDSQRVEEDQQDVEDQLVQEDFATGASGINFDEIVSPIDVDRETALLGVNVEEDDEEEQDVEGNLGAAEISEEHDDSQLSGIEPVAGISDDSPPAQAAAEDSALSMGLTEETVDTAVEDSGLSSFRNEELTDIDSGPAALFTEDEVQDKLQGDDPVPEDLIAASFDDEQVLAGVDVYSDADDDSEEEPLPVTEGDLAPALSSAVGESEETVEDEVFVGDTEGTQTKEEILSTVEGFFDEHEEVAAKDRGEQHPGERDGELAVDEAEPIGKEGLAADLIDDDVAGDPEEELLSFIDDTDSSDLLSDGGAEVSSEDDNVELEESIEAFFTETSEADPIVDEIETELDTDLEEDRGGSPAVLVKEAERAVEEEQGVIDRPELVDDEEFTRPLAPAVEKSDDSLDVKKTYIVPAFKLATPQARSARLLEDVAGEQIDDFDLSEGIAEETILSETAAADEPIVLLDTDTVEGGEEEVVFELVEEDEEFIDSSPDSEVGEVEEESPESPMQELVEEVRFDSHDSLSTLQLCIDSLEVEIDDKVFSEMHNAIHRLRQSFVDKPVEKTFIELFATICRHIDKYRSESSDGAHSLLTSVFDAFKRSSENDEGANQEQLFIETCKVLSWQQDMLEKQSAETAADQSDAADVRDEFDKAFVEFEKQNL